MRKTFAWLKNNKFTIHSLAFLLMILIPLPLFWAAQQAAEGWILLLLSLFIGGNLLVLATQ
jgi:hypothetical protein